MTPDDAYSGIDWDSEPIDLRLDASALGNLGDTLGIVEGSAGDLGVFGGQESTLAEYMDSVTPVMEIDSRIPSREDILRTATNPDALATRQRSLTETYGTTVHSQEVYSDTEGPTLRVGREIDEDGRVVVARPAITRDDIEALRKQIAERIPDVLVGFEPFAPSREKMDLIARTVDTLLKSGQATPNRIAPTAVNIQTILDEITGLGPLAPLAKDPEVSDIIVRRHDRVFAERSGRLYFVEGVAFPSRDEYKEFIERITVTEGRQITPTKPILDMHLSDGSRVSIIGPPLTDDEQFYLTIRRFRAKRFNLRSLLELGTINEEMEIYLTDVMAAKANVLLYGGTGAGKTATLEALISAKLPDESIVTAEDTREIKIEGHENWRPMVTRINDNDKAKSVDMRKLVKAALRMRPDSIIVGETRDETAYDILVAMNSGHNGCMTTVHANNSHSALRKFEMLARQAEEKPPPETLRESICESFDLVVGIQRQGVDRSRRITSIDEVVGYDVDKDTYVLRNVFRYISVNRPNEPVRHKFIRNPGYYTTPNLQQKLREINRAYVPPPDGSDEEYLGNLISDEVIREEREYERLRLEQAKREQEARLREFREATRRRAKLRRKQSREDERRRNAARRAAAAEDRRREIEERKERERKERQAVRAAERVRRRAEARREGDRARVEAAEAEETRRLIRESLREQVEAEVARFEAERAAALIAEGVREDEARKAAAILAGAHREEQEARYRSLNAWQRRNLPKAREIYARVEQGLSFEAVAAERGVTVNNILKYVRIVDNAMVDAYLSLRREAGGAIPAVDDVTPAITEADMAMALPWDSPAERQPMSGGAITGTGIGGTVATGEHDGTDGDREGGTVGEDATDPLLLEILGGLMPPETPDGGTERAPSIDGGGE